MTETTLAPLPAANPGLNAALAAVQAEYPKVAKGKTADTGTYSYDYADLASISETVLPLLGRNGLAFIAKPTRNSDGDFVLAYSLVHKSGEREDGQYPLPSSGNAQALGSAITYARRYSLCAITGIAPGGEDDDGAAASQVVQTSRQRQRPPAQAPAEPDAAAIADWGAKIDEIATPEDADKADAELKAVFGNGRMDATTANAIRGAIKKKAASLTPAPAGEADTQAAEFGQRAATAKDLAGLTEVWVQIRAAKMAGAPFTHDGKQVTLATFVNARKAEFESRQPEMAGAS